MPPSPVLIADTSAQDVPAPPIGRARRWLPAVAALVAFLAGGGYALHYYHNLAGVDDVVDASQLRFARVERGMFVRDAVAQGRVITANSPTLFSPESGYVKLEVKAGARVKRQQVLATVDSPELLELLQREQTAAQKLQSQLDYRALDIRSREFQLQKMQDLAEVNLKALQREKQRSDKLMAKQLISRMQYEKMLDDLERAQLEFNLSKRQNGIEQESVAFELKMLEQDLQRQQLLVSSLERRLRALEILSPVDGIVGNLQVKDRQAVGAFQPLMTVVDLTHFEIEAYVAEEYADDLAPGMEAEIRLNGDTLEGSVLALSPEVVQSQVVVRIAFTDTTPRNLRQNQRLTVRIFMENRADTLQLARGTFLDGFSGYLYRCEGDKAYRTAVQLGSRSYTHVEILDGLNEGDDIIVSSLNYGPDTVTLLLRGTSERGISDSIKGH